MKLLFFFAWKEFIHIFFWMALPCLLMVLMAVAMETGAKSDNEENGLDYGFWNYREGGKSLV